MTAGLAVIDLDPWADGDDATRRRIGAEVVAAFARSGFAYAVNHGLPAHTREDVFTAARRFFTAPDPVRGSVHYRGNYRGYVPFDDPESPSPAKQSYDCGLEFTDAYHGPGAQLRASRNRWPDLPGFRPAVEAYLTAVRQLADAVLSMIATGLGWAPDYFRIRCDRPVATLRLLQYRCQPVVDGKGLSVGTHSDYEALTVLAQDDVGGLQVRRPDGSWLEVSPLPDALVLNIGEMLTMWTNDRLPATPHRVRTPQAAERYSVAFFYGTNYDVLIEPPTGPDAAPSRYPAVTTGEYLHRRLLEVGG